MSHLGNIARNGELFSLTMLSWCKADKNNLEMIWSSVKENTNALDGFNDICFTKMEISWKPFKHRVKDFYKNFKTYAECLANVPPRVEPRQWPTLVAYWSLGVTQMRLENKPVDLVNMWRGTRAKCGSYNEKDGAAGTEKMLERRIEEPPMEERDNEEQLNKVYKEVVGQDGHGRVLGREVGIRQCGKCLTSSTSQTEVEKQQMLKLNNCKKMRRSYEKRLRH